MTLSETTRSEGDAVPKSTSGGVQKCVPCEGGTPSMPAEEARKHLAELKDWTLGDNRLNKQFKFADFVASMKFVNAVAALAEQEGHHPDITISYNKVGLVLWTHAVKGLSLNDFILAAKIDEL